MQPTQPSDDNGIAVLERPRTWKNRRKKKDENQKGLGSIPLFALSIEKSDISTKIAYRYLVLIVDVSKIRSTSYLIYLKFNLLGNFVLMSPIPYTRSVFERPRFDS
jgi:hypothetical protein